MLPLSWKRQVKYDNDLCYDDMVSKKIEKSFVKINTKNTKSLLINKLICRIQNLFPDKCRYCDKSYCISVSDEPLLECSICGQGCHDPCV